MKGKRGISLSIPKRVLLHLAEYINTKDAFEVNTAITQPGIAGAIDIRLEHVSRSVKKLLDEELIKTKSAHVTGSYRRRKAYYLTPKGIEHVKNIEQWFDNKDIIVRTQI